MNLKQGSIDQYKSKGSPRTVLVAQELKRALRIQVWEAKKGTPLGKALLRQEKLYARIRRPLLWVADKIMCVANWFYDLAEIRFGPVQLVTESEINRAVADTLEHTGNRSNLPDGTSILPASLYDQDLYDAEAAERDMTDQVILGIAKNTDLASGVRKDKKLRADHDIDSYLGSALRRGDQYPTPEGSEE